MFSSPTVVLVLLKRHCTLMQKFGSSFFLYIATHYEIIKKNASNRKISPRLIILHVGKVSMHDIKSATLTILLDGVVSAVKAGRWQPSKMVKKTF